MTDLFCVVGQHLLDAIPFGSSYAIRTESLRDFIAAYDAESGMLDVEIDHLLG
jgi:hypothetical protein